MGPFQLGPGTKSCSTYAVPVHIPSWLSPGSGSALCLMLAGLLVGTAAVSTQQHLPCSATVPCWEGASCAGVTLTPDLFSPCGLALPLVLPDRHVLVTA